MGVSVQYVALVAVLLVAVVPSHASENRCSDYAACMTAVKDQAEQCTKKVQEESAARPNNLKSCMANAKNPINSWKKYDFMATCTGGATTDAVDHKKAGRCEPLPPFSAERMMRQRSGRNRRGNGRRGGNRGAHNKAGNGGCFKQIKQAKAACRKYARCCPADKTCMEQFKGSAIFNQLKTEKQAMKQAAQTCQTTYANQEEQTQKQRGGGKNGKGGRRTLSPEEKAARRANRRQNKQKHENSDDVKLH